MKNLTLERIINIVLALASISLLIYLLFYFSTLVFYAIVAIIISYLLDPLVSRIQAAGINRTLGIALTLSALIMVLVWISTNVLPVVVSEMVELASQLNIQNIQSITQQIEQRLVEKFTFLPEHFLSTNITQTLQNFFNLGQLQSALSDLIGLFTNIFWAALVIPFATFFFLKDGSKIRRDILRLVPNKYFETTLSLIDKVETRLGIYFRSVMLQSLIVALASWLGLTIVGLNNALSVGIAIGLANTIPYFGPMIGYILSIVVSIIEVGDFSLILPCIIAIACVQLLDNMVLQPLIFSRSADMHPVAILFIIMVGAQLGGILGMLFAIPVATVIKITVNQIRWSINNYHIFRSADSQDSL